MLDLSSAPALYLVGATNLGSPAGCTFPGHEHASVCQVMRPAGAMCRALDAPYAHYNFFEW